MNKSMIEVGHSIVNMVHSPPKVGDQANNDMAKMFANSPQKYSEFLRTQAEKFKK
jgi:ubiquitin-protein ligase